MGRMALEGLRVIDLGQVFAGPFASRLLADMGAEVIRVESALRSGRGGIRPQPGAVYPDDDPGPRPYNRSAYYNELNRNKYAVSLDLSLKEGQEVFKRLVQISDVLVENFSPRVMKNFGLDYPVLCQLKPDLIMASISAYGASGPYRDYVAFGHGVEAMAGLSQLTGYPDGPPLHLGVAYADAVAGLYAAFAILAALRQRRRSGHGRHLDLSLRQPLTSLLGEQILDYIVNKRLPPRNGNRHFLSSPHGCYRCRGEDNWLVIAISSDEEWASFCRSVGRPAWAKDERFATAPRRWQNQRQLDELITGWTEEQDHQQAMHLLQRAGVAAAAVATACELLADPHLKERRFFEEVTHLEAGTHPHPGMAWKLSKTPGSIRRAAPCFAEHNQHVFGQLLGMPAQDLSILSEKGVIASSPRP